MEENIKSNKNIYTHLIIRYLLLRWALLALSVSGCANAEHSEGTPSSEKTVMTEPVSFRISFPACPLAESAGIHLLKIYFN